MKTTTSDSESLHRLVTDAVLGPDFRRATFGGKRHGEAARPWRRVVIRAVRMRRDNYWQFSYFDATRDVSKNVRAPDVAGRLGEVLAAGFAAIHLATRTEELDIHTSRKGKVHVRRRRIAEAGDEPLPEHNRVKEVPLPEGRANRLLEVMGILTPEGKVRPSRRAKYTQINEFLKQLTHVLPDAGLRDLGRPVEILDCGCGASYLTLAVHHYLNEVLAIPARILGVDVNEEVIRKSVERSRQLGAERLDFACQAIGAVDARPDMVLALHACDTATDEALARAITAEARLLLSVPCCHHHLNDQLRAEGPAGVLRPLLRHGILHQRTADLVTDAFRALILRLAGYRTDVVEFVGTEHTARNLMLRAVRGAPVGDAALVQEYLQLRSFWGVTPYLEQALGEPFQHLLAH